MWVRGANQWLGSHRYESRTIKRSSQSTEETRSVQIPSLLGMRLMPLRFVLSLLSKTDDFLPCAERSQIYWTITIHLILSDLVWVFPASLGYDGDQSWIV